MCLYFLGGVLSFMDVKDEEIKSFKHHKKAGKGLNNVYGELNEILGSKEGLMLSNSYNRDLIEGMC